MVITAMTPLPLSPFMNPSVESHSPEGRAVATNAPEATARFDRYFDPDAFMNYILIGFRERMIDDDPPPLFIGGPSDDFIEACHRDLLPMLYDYTRRAL